MMEQDNTLMPDVVRDYLESVKIANLRNIGELSKMTPEDRERRIDEIALEVAEAHELTDSETLPSEPESEDTEQDEPLRSEPSRSEQPELVVSSGFTQEALDGVSAFDQREKDRAKSELLTFMRQELGFTS